MASEVKATPANSSIPSDKPVKPVPQQKKKKKKNAPDRPQPEWMFPPDEENPILNPKPKSEEQLRKEREERDLSIKFLQYKSVTAPMKPAPPGILLTLVGSFLTSYGFNSASRLYTSQCKSRKKLEAWDHELGAKLPKGFPDLVKIYKDWYKEYQEDLASDASSSGGDDNPNAKEPKSNKSTKVLTQAESDETSSSSGSDSSDEIESEKPAKASANAQKSGKRPNKAGSLSASSSSSTSESDADDEKEAVSTGPSKPTVNGMIKNLKRKASVNKSANSKSSSESSALSVDEGRPLKKSKVEASKVEELDKDATKTEAKFAAGVKPAKAATSRAAPIMSSSSTSESPSSESEPALPTQKKVSDPPSKKSLPRAKSDTLGTAKVSKSAQATKAKDIKRSSSDSLKSTDSSATLEIASEDKPVTSNTSTSSSSSSSPSSSEAGFEPSMTKAKTEASAAPKRKSSHSPSSTGQKIEPKNAAKKQSTPFQRVPKDTQVDPKLASNAYISYDYADRAHKDLSVTRGKDFTKEKNKKKRGSYRGGAIDVDSRKGVKFDD